MAWMISGDGAEVVVDLSVDAVSSFGCDDIADIDN